MAISEVCKFELKELQKKYQQASSKMGTNVPILPNPQDPRKTRKIKKSRRMGGKGLLGSLGFFVFLQGFIDQNSNGLGSGWEAVFKTKIINAF